MSDIGASLREAMRVEGAIGAALVDWNSGMTLGALGGGEKLNIHVAAAGNTDVIRAKMKTMSHLRLEDEIEDILISLNTQIHLIRPLTRNRGLFLYLAVMRDKVDLATARRRLFQIESVLTV